MTRKSVRKDLERHVLCYHAPLADYIKKMNTVILLRYAHPTERANFAAPLFQSGSITLEQYKEFNEPIFRI